MSASRTLLVLMVAALAGTPAIAQTDTVSSALDALQRQSTTARRVFNVHIGDDSIPVHLTNRFGVDAMARAAGREWRSPTNDRSGDTTTTRRVLRMCFVPGNPGTADILIPGSPGIPAIGDQPAVPPTPSTIIPGIPATPDAWVACM